MNELFTFTILRECHNCKYFELFNLYTCKLSLSMVTWAWYLKLYIVTWNQWINHFWIKFLPLIKAGIRYTHMHGIPYFYLAIMKMIYRSYPGNYDEKIYSLFMYIIGKWCISSNLGIWYKATDQLNFVIKMPFDKVYSEICMIYTYDSLPYLWWVFLKNRSWKVH